MDRPDRHNEIELNFLKTGSVTYLLGGGKATVTKGRLAVFWGAIPHQIIGCSSTTEYFVVTIPLVWFLQRRLPNQFTQILLHGRMLQVDSKASDSCLFEIWEGDLRKKQGGLEHAVLLEMQARMMRLSRDLPDAANEQAWRDSTGTFTGSGLSKVEKMACYIAQHYTNQLSVDDIANVVGLHPNYAMTLFHKMFSTSLVRYLTQHRISHAQRLLVTSDRTVSDVAYDSGFNSISRFNAAFRQSCGCSPREYRSKHSLVEATFGCHRREASRYYEVEHDGSRSRNRSSRRASDSSLHQ